MTDEWLIKKITDRKDVGVQNADKVEILVETKKKKESDIKGNGGGLICVPVAKFRLHGLCNTSIRSE